MPDTLPCTALPCTIVADGLRLALRLTPRAPRTAIAGVVDDGEGRPLLQLRINAPPVDGAANSALTAFLATAFRLRKADVTLVSGATARVKMVHLAGDGTALATRLRNLIAESGKN